MIHFMELSMRTADFLKKRAWNVALEFTET
jgi:hypothetical protein